MTGHRSRPLTIRRSRGYVPASLTLPLTAAAPILACGAELKSTFCLGRADRAWVSHHIGDLRNWETLRSYREGVEHFEELFALAPRILAHDLHPDYLSSTYAAERRARAPEGSVQTLAVQHHHAHLAAVLAEHGESGPAVGAIYDGAGYGSDGTVWGGELLVGGLRDFQRAGHLRTVRLPGGDRATREPWRMACVWIAQASGEAIPPIPRTLSEDVGPERWSAVARLADQGLAAPLTSSVGRLLDAVGALCGLRSKVSYEGQAAIELEAAADPDEAGAYAIAWDGRRLDPCAAILEVLGDLGAGRSPATVSARFHNALARVTVRACADLAAEHGVQTLVLAGGVFQNRLLLEQTCAGAREAGLRVLLPRRLPPNDGAISFGQAAIAAATAGGALN